MKGLDARDRSRSRVRLAAGGSVATAIALVCWLTGHAEAAERLRLGLGLTSCYTDNLLQYSDEQVLLFESGTAPERFSIESVGDAMFSPSASLTWEATRPRGRSREIRLRGVGEFHGRNGTADFHAVSLRWRESFGRDRRLSLGGYYLPAYYLRQLYDEDIPSLPGLSRYRRAEFSLAIGSIAWRQRLARRVRGELGYQYERRGYDADFEERTSNTHEGGLSVEWYRLARRGAVELRAGYRRSLARADDSDAIPADDQDVSYHGIVTGVSGRMGLMRQSTWSLFGSLNYEFATRDYDSNRVTDAAHYRRNDRRHTVGASVQCELPADVTARVFYHIEDNSARFPAGAGPSGDPASYTENQVGVAIDWSAVLWRSARIESPPVEEAP